MPDDFDALYTAASEYLEACKTALAVTPAGTPRCFWISPGAPVIDPDLTETNGCLIVHVGGPAIGDTLPLQPSMAPLHRIIQAGEVNLVPLTATIVRAAPEVDASGIYTDADQVNRVARQTSADLWTIWNYVKAAKARDLLFAPSQRELELQPAISIPQQGGAVGWQIPIRVNIYGYTPTTIGGP